ncbi:alpha/beta fold hydrolase [Micromonospora sp. NPDC000089]|uniref:alpha/beta fold hydrolase n=1 Tax=unclassified Micromonospora TaxID=2617518 RepID=UPI003674A155
MNQYPLVLVPGLAGSVDEFAAQVEHFSPGRLVRAIEPFRDGDLSVDGQARRLAELLIKEGIERCGVVGHSHGGLVALSLAVHHPGLVAGLVLLDTPVLLPKPLRLLARLPLAILRTPLGPAAIRRFFTATFTDADSAQWRTTVLARLARVPRPAVQEIVGGTFTYDSATPLRALTVPTLYIRANIPMKLDRLPVGVRGASLPTVGHWPHVHAPQDTNRLIAAYLEGLPR